MSEKYLSLRAAATLLGFASTSPIEDALKSGELKGERRPGVVRNGRSTSPWRILHDDVVTFAEARGRPLSEAADTSAANATDQATDSATEQAAEAAQEPLASTPEPAVEASSTSPAQPQPNSDDAPSDVMVELGELRGTLQAVRHLAALDMSADLWRALRAIVGATGGANGEAEGPSVVKRSRSHRNSG
jgi:hypothetical protein